MKSRASNRLSAITSAGSAGEQCWLNDTDDFVKVQLDTHLTMIKVMAETPMRLMYTALPDMIERRQGSIINVASMLSLLGPVYRRLGAVKAYLVSLSQAVALETWKQGIHISVLCPGLAHTEIFGTDGLDSARRLPSWLWMEADDPPRCRPSANRAP